MPLSPGVDVVRIANEAAVGLAEPVREHTGIAAPKYVRASVPIDVAGADDMPCIVDSRVGGIADKASVGLGEPVGDQPIVISPENIVLPVAVEVAGADEMPVAAQHHVKWVARKAP